jgi:hypothetical protein
VKGSQMEDSKKDNKNTLLEEERLTLEDGHCTHTFMHTHIYMHTHTCSRTVYSEIVLLWLQGEAA